MKQFEDTAGLRYTARDEAAALALEDVQAAYLGSRRDIPERMQGTDYQADAPMALVIAGYLNLMFSTPGAARKARASRDVLQGVVERFGVNDREAFHVAAFDEWCGGRLDAAAAQLEGLLADYPKDAFALKIAQYLHLYGGTPRAMRDSVARVFPRWSPRDPSYGYVQGIYSFALEEAGEYAAAEAAGKAAVEAHADDAWAAHAVAHVFEMQGRVAEGIEWLAALAGQWSETNNFRYHLDWHEALFHLELDQTDAALALYDDRVRQDLGADFYLDQCNATALLQRLVLHGADVADRWDELAELARGHLTDRELVFSALHQLLALLAAGDRQSALALLANLDAWRDGQQGNVAARAGRPLAEALVAYFDQQFEAVISLIEAIGDDLDTIGGSHAQRDLFRMIHVDALLRAGHFQTAEALLSKRVQNAPPTSWNYRQLQRCRTLARSA